MKEILYVFMGSGIGGVLRYSISLVLKKHDLHFPYHTLIANAIACFMIGYLFASIKLTGENILLKYGLIIGICGGLSTYSTFSLELFHQASLGEWLYFGTYTILTFTLCLGLTLLGYRVGL